MSLSVVLAAEVPTPARAAGLAAGWAEAGVVLADVVAAGAGPPVPTLTLGDCLGPDGGLDLGAFGRRFDALLAAGPAAVALDGTARPLAAPVPLVAAVGRLLFWDTGRRPTLVHFCWPHLLGFYYREWVELATGGPAGGGDPAAGAIAAAAALRRQHHPLTRLRAKLRRR